jgi:hypothetical protein
MLSYLDRKDEFQKIKGARPPRRKRKLLGALRGGAAHYGWSRDTFDQVTDLLYEARVLYREEWDWLRAVGPASLPERMADVRTAPS